MTLDLFSDPDGCVERLSLGPGASVLRGRALPHADALFAEVCALERHSPFRRMTTAGGHTMSMASTNCGSLGWISDRNGYHYGAIDPETRAPWPPMPALFAHLARDTALEAGFPEFEPDACLINRYLPGAKLSLHQDRDERDFGAPIVTVSLGMDAVFLFGGHVRADKTVRVPLRHGDVVVWGGEDRLRYHGVMAVPDHPHPLLGRQRISLTFRKAG
ncbi:DNA oxidative demethylase AlkB [Paludibacterium yongneupense]|uniref:DNA oxidative demethylase AlkB n=1 Tax=Paludibacterium yongneupense TaxID=400061 RepID=UPI00048A8FF2|nr:DNA oxidative demethylase AlkB [Paludibacterium yongneupense]